MDHSLIARCQRGDHYAWRQLYERYAASVYRWSMAFGLDRTSAEEAVQDVFVTAHRRLGSCRNEAQLPAWFFQTTRRHAANARRLSWAKRVVGWGDSTSESDETGEPSPNGSNGGPRVELSFEVRRALGTLPLHLVEVLILHDLDGRTRDEIAEFLGIASGTVASRLRSAREQFARAWE